MPRPRFNGAGRARLTLHVAVAQVPVAHAYQIEQAIQSQIGDRMASGLAHQWLRPKCDAHSGNAKHGKIIGAIANRDHLIEGNIFLSGNLSQQLCLARAVLQSAS